ncbi:MAG: T9SS type A sorting domain-containing protein [Bacteroidota bacterium]
MPLTLPFAGGINGPNHQFFDAEGDGDYDLFVFDQDITLDFYKNDGTRFSPDFRLATAEFMLPAFNMWFLFQDLNGDGLQDLCTDDAELSGVRYYINTGTAEEPLFTIADSTVFDTSGSPILGGLNSVPGFSDIDNDGDFDFFSVNSTGGTINFYQNTGSAQTPQFAFVTDYWQSIQIIGGKKNKHGAAAIRFCDIDNDGDDDLFYGDLFTFGLYLFRNISDSLIAETDNFPLNDPVESFGFNMPQLVDIDGDYDFDLFVGSLHPGTSMHSFSYFRNTGTITTFQFVRITNDYLPMIDVGKNSHPAFCDIDADGDKDLFIGSIDKGVLFFKNIAQQSNAVDVLLFELADTNFANVGGNYDYDPLFIDIDNDTDFDLFIGNFSGRLQFYKNNGTPTSPAFVLAAFPATDSIHISQSLAPEFADIDADGDYDLFVGKPNGTIAFYRNIGNASSFQPVLENSSYQNIDVGENAKPQFLDFDNDEDKDLFIGNTSGSLYYFENIGTMTNPQFILSDAHFAQTDKASEFDPALVDFDDDNDFDVFLGNAHGGVQLYENKKFSIAVNENLTHSSKHFSLAQNYPNPFNPKTAIGFSLLAVSNVTLKVYDITGKEVATLLNSVPLNSGSHQIQFDGSNLTSGIYFYQLSVNGYSATKKFIILK